jgi:hypothetical protein
MLRRNKSVIPESAADVCQSSAEKLSNIRTNGAMGDATLGRHCHGEEPKVRGKRSKRGV